MDIEPASLLASIMIGMIGINWSRWLLAHPKVFTVAAVIPMFPGISAYTAMISVVEISHLGYSEVLMSTMVTNFLKASFIVGSFDWFILARIMVISQTSWCIRFFSVSVFVVG